MAMRHMLVKHTHMVNKMTRKLMLPTLTLISAILLASLISNDRVLHCEADLVDSININTKGNIKSNLKIHYIFNLNGSQSGKVSIIGFVDSEEKRYRLDRILYLEYKKQDNDNVFKFVNSDEIINANDTLPNEFMSWLFIQAGNSGIYPYRISKVTENVYLVHEISQPLLLCHKQ